mmetsp:Transcript_21669/g.26836  ORF Transcript_21669/g.26836 Transcript_21669/m.26836 type:complete len:274 (-) Transcript_21669:76-897(-)
MFSANENIQLRQYKRRVVQYVEDTIPPSVLDAGTNVMAMQISCKQPGCVPLETAIAIIFPRLNKRLMDGLEESNGGTFKTKILMPMSQVTKDDVLEALPADFIGGKRTIESLCLKIRDVTLGQIGQIMDDAKGRRQLVDYLMSALEDYKERDCVAPEIGKPFPPLEKKPANDVLVKDAIKKGGNFVVKRVIDDDDDKPMKTKATGVASKLTPEPKSVMPQAVWRQKQRMDVTSSDSIIQKLSEREHAPGIRRTGCPCCDPDNPANIVDSMMML